ncbi:MAG: UDP-2,3-diacylglucosamine diphosphatase LpxI, partial [Desulfobacterales bacterium]
RAVAVKVCKPGQDERFDVPAVGLKTVQTMVDAHIQVLAIEARRAIVFDREDMVEAANRHRLTIVALEAP